MLGGLLAEEDELDRRALWRIGSWGVAATGAVILAVMANQSSLGLKRDQMAAADLTRQAQQIQSVARETQNEARRLAAAIDTLNSDRDRLYARVTGLEQGLESVTGAIARQGSAQRFTSRHGRAARRSRPACPGRGARRHHPDRPGRRQAGSQRRGTRPATVSSVAKDAVKTDAAKAEATKAELAKIEGAKTETAKTETAKPDSGKADTAKPDGAKPSPATPLMATQSIMAPPDPAAAKLIEPSKALNGIIASPIPEVVAAAPSRTRTTKPTRRRLRCSGPSSGSIVGTANSVNGLRALWRGLLKSRSNAPLARCARSSS